MAVAPGPDGPGAPPRLRRWAIETTDRLDRVSWPERRRLAALPADLAHYEELLLGLPLFGKIEARLPPDLLLTPPDRLRVGFVCLGPRADLAGIGRLLDRSGLDVLLVPEVDVGMSRSGNLHEAAVLADSLDMGYAFAVEALALPGDDPDDRSVGAADLYGLLGTAMLFRPTLQALGGLRVDMSGRWFQAAAERRLGGTVALFARIGLGHEFVTLTTVALDPALPMQERRQQVLSLLERLDAHDPLSPALVALDPGGDDLFQDLGSFAERPRIARLALSLGRLDPLLGAFLKRGFSWASGHLSAGARSAPRSGVFFARKLRCEAARVVPAVDASGNRFARSDLAVVEIGLP
ncbi:MAG: hypothetical protein KDG89_08340 [Geminicoccaceae bacterium]|nr:hypothetical protein [Geminicoccaceae bacterium]